MKIVRISEIGSFDNGRFVFSYTKVLFTCADNAAFCGRSPLRMTATKSEITSSMTNIAIIPIEAYCPVYIADMTRAPVLSLNIYIKRPDFGLYDEENSPDITDQLSREISTFELLLNHPHPNIVKYHGCEVSDGKVTGIHLQACETTVTDLVNPRGLNKRALRKSYVYDNNDGFDRCFKELESALLHLHSLGLAHNDLNPANVMISNGHLILIDLDSCLPFGASLDRAKRTPEWHDPNVEVSAAENDLDALHELKVWLSRSTEEFRFQ